MPLVDKDPSRAETREEEHLICPRERERRTKRERGREMKVDSFADKGRTNEDQIKSFRVETLILYDIHTL